MVVQFFPASPTQQRIVEWCDDPDCSIYFKDRLLIRWALLIKPSADERRIKRAFEKLCKRHDILQMRFDRHKNTIRVAMPASHPVGVQIQDFGDKSRDEINTIVNRLAKEPMPVFSDSLFEVLLLKFGSGGDALVMRIHHVISDGFGVVVLIEDFIKYLLNVPILSKAISHANYLAGWGKIDPKITKKNDAFWEETLLPVLDQPNIGRHAKGLPVITELNMPKPFSRKLKIPKAELSKLHSKAGNEGLTLTNYVMAAMGDAICKTAGCTETYLTAYQGRMDARLNTYIGLHSHMLVIKYDIYEQRTQKESAQLVADKMKACMAHVPTQALAGTGQVHQQVREHGSKLKQYMVHIPIATGRARGSAFAEGFFAKKGNVQRVGPYQLEAIQLEKSAETDGELQIDITEDTTGFELQVSADSEAFTPTELGNFARVFLSVLRGE